MTTLKYGKASEAKLAGVTVRLVAVARRALEISSASPTPIDWAIVDGLRTAAYQAKLVETGASYTLKSAHLAGPDGFSHALDYRIYLGPNVNPFPLKSDSPAVVKEKLERHAQVIAFFFEAADEQNFPLQSGNDWDLDGVPTGRDPDERGMLQDMVHLQEAPAHRVQQAIERAKARKEARARGERVIS